MSRARDAFVVGGVFLITASAALAHKPIWLDEPATGPDSAVPIDDVTISYVLYQEITEPGRQLWLTFEAAAGQEVYAQLGVPFIDRYAEFRPEMALLGPGLPEVDLPFDVPDGLGGQVLRTQDLAEPEVYDERFTGTQSWIMGEIVTMVPEAGKHYLVVYAPGEQTGKLWIAPGRREVFGLIDVVTLPETIGRVRTFHEIPPFYIPCFLPALVVGGFLGIGLRLVSRRRTVRPSS